MKTIAVINQKGGVGKSTTASAIGGGLTLEGAKVLFVDLDAQCNLSYLMEASISGLTQASALDVLQGNASAAEAVQHTAQGDVIAASPALAGAGYSIDRHGQGIPLKRSAGGLSGALRLLRDRYPRSHWEY